MKIKAFAKINLVLNVLNKRQDGYHNVNFLMTKVNLYDEITVTKSNQSIVQVVNYPELSGESNLAFKALELLKKKYCFEQNYTIQINKKIPVAAGMAGGSSDAAAVLIAINQMQELNLSLTELAQLGSEIGADVPFCIYSQLAHVQGFGEQVSLIDTKIPKAHVLVVNPGIALSTEQVYTYQEHQNPKYDIPSLLKKTSHDQFYKSLSNDLEQTAFKLIPKLQQIKAELKQLGATKVMLSGSGPTMLAFFEDYQTGYEQYQKVIEKYKYVYYVTIDTNDKCSS